MNLAQAMLNIGARIPITDKSIKDRLNRAYDIVRCQGEGYEVVKPSQQSNFYYVNKASTSLFTDTSARYIVTTTSCTCPDFEKARAGLCKHRLAVILIEEMKTG